MKRASQKTKGVIRQERIFIVAEMAQSYEGSVDIAVDIATKVCKAGVDAVMFQIVYADELAVPENKNYKLFRSLELPAESWRKIVTKVHQTGGMAFGEVFGERSVNVALDAGIDGFKIHTADISNNALLRLVGKTNLPILLSVGGSLESEVKKAINVLENSGKCEIILMHGYQLCPTPLEDTHIMKIHALKEMFNLPVGYADHIAGCVDGDVSQANPSSQNTSLLAIGAGAKVIEKHVILDRTRTWEDYESALTPDEFVYFVSLIKNFEKSLGTKNFEFTKSEEKYRNIAKKHIVASCDIPTGTIIQEKHITFKRINKPEEGIVSNDEVIGKTLSRSVRYNDVIKRDNLSGNEQLETHVDAILACRVQGSRLYGKPLQRLVPSGITILESLIEYLHEIKSIRKIILAISKGEENHGFTQLAEQLCLPYVIGDEHDVLQRIIDAAKQEGTKNIFRITTEGPFVLYEYADALIKEFLEEGYDFARYKDTPEGTGYEIVSTKALQNAHDRGDKHNRSELVTSYICEHQDEFKMLTKKLPKHLSRPEVRLTVDYSEDLVFCQTVYKNLKKNNRLISVEQIISFWDNNPNIRKPVENIGIDWGTGRLVWDSDDEKSAKK